jgi:hypothetical protein
MIGNRASGGHQRLRGHLTAERSQRRSLVALAAEDVFLDELECQQLDEGREVPGVTVHLRSLADA